MNTKPPMTNYVDYHSEWTGTTTWQSWTKEECEQAIVEMMEHYTRRSWYEGRGKYLEAAKRWTERLLKLKEQRNPSTDLEGQNNS